MLKGLKVKRTAAQQHEEVAKQEQEKSEPIEQAPAANVENAAPKLQRASWMTDAPDGGLLSHVIRSDKQEQQPAEETKKLPNILNRELNPYYKDGGNGLPEHQTSSEITATVGDGGAAWKAKALLRAQERAKEENANVDQVLGERWGVTAAEMEAKVGDVKRYASYSYSKSKMMKPQRNDSNSFKWSSSSPRDKDSQQDKDEKHKSYRRESPPRKSYTKEKSYTPASETKVAITSTSTTTMNTTTTTTTTTSTTTTPSPQVKKPRFAPAPKLSPEEMNKLAAKALKAQIMGDMTLYQELNAQLEAAKGEPQSQDYDDNDQVVVLPDMDSKGRKIASSMAKYDANTDIKDIARLTKETGEDEHAVDKAMLKTKLYKAKNTEEEYDMMGEENFSRKKRKRHGTEEEQVRKKQITEHQRYKATMSECPFCYGSKMFNKSLMLALGEKVLLMIPPFGSITPYHCVLVTMEHHSSVTDMDEEEIAEIMRFKQSLVQMFAAMKMEPVFYETVTPYNLKKRRHTCIECVPIPIAQAQSAPGFFKKSIMDADSEWSQHTKVIDTTGKGIRRAIPKEFPYFHVEFALGGGYAHVIEDETKFPITFGKEVVAGILKLPSNAAKAKYKANVEKEREQLQHFLNAWEPYDWTKELDGGQY